MNHLTVDTLILEYDPERFQCCKFDELQCFKHLNDAYAMECECVKCPSRECKKQECDQFAKCSKRKKNDGLKGVDVLLHNAEELFLIESKDYRPAENIPVEHIVSEVLKKFRDSLFILWCAGSCADVAEEPERLMAESIRKNTGKIHFVFNFVETGPDYASGLFRQNQGPHSSMNIQTLFMRKLGRMNALFELIRLKDDSQICRNRGWQFYDCPESDCKLN